MQRLATARAVDLIRERRRFMVIPASCDGGYPSAERRLKQRCGVKLASLLRLTAVFGSYPKKARMRRLICQKK
jgi:hypothetical protein